MPNVVRVIEILAYPDAQLLDVTGPLQVFASANEEMLKWGKAAPYSIHLVAESEAVVTSSGLVLLAKPLDPSSPVVDTLLVAGGRGVNRACARTTLVDWIRQRARLARRTASVCSGAFLLAEAGLLTGRRAATHWGRNSEFAARYPSVVLEPDPIFIQDGPIWTSAGVTAGIDLALAMVEADLDRGIALAVARELVVFLKRPGGQAQFSTALALQSSDARFERLNGWIADNLRADLSVPALAEVAAMSARSFSRRYTQATGQTPARAVELIRVEAARRMLEDHISVGRVARRCGFGSEETMRRSFLRTLGVGPQAYLDRF
jgi:transcriptional regulator GlxA family with amidase domain